MNSAAKTSDNTRRTVLFILLIITIGIFAYDVGVAKRGWEAAIDKLNKTVNDTETLKTNKTFGPQEIQALIGRQPVASGAAKDAPNKIPQLLKSAKPEDWAHKLGYFEVYQWRRGIPFLKYTLFVSYTGPQQDPVFYQFQPGGKLEPSLFRGVKLPDNFNQTAKMAKKRRGARRAVAKAPGTGDGKQGKGKSKEGAGKAHVTKTPSAKSPEKTAPQKKSPQTKSPEKKSPEKPAPKTADEKDGKAS